MSDLRSQLMAKLGATPPAEAPAGKAGAAAPDLDPDAHLGTPWMAALRAVRAPGSPPIPPRPSLNAARQLTDKAIRALKDGGQARAARDLGDLRSDFLKKREKEAWNLIKARFTDLSLSERAYRALKQSEADAEKIWARLRKTPEAELAAMGADRLREHLLG